MDNLKFDFDFNNGILENIEITCYVVMHKDLNGVVKQLGFYTTQKQAFEEIDLCKFYDKKAYDKIDGIYRVYKVKFDAISKTNPIKFYGVKCIK